MPYLDREAKRANDRRYNRDDRKRQPLERRRVYWAKKRAKPGYREKFAVYQRRYRAMIKFVAQEIGL